MSVTQKFIQNIQYEYASTIIDLLTTQFEEMQLAKEREPAIQLMNDVTGKSKNDAIKDILTILYESKKDFDSNLVKNNQSTAIIAFGLDENGLSVQDAYFDGMMNTQYDEKSPAHKFCNTVINEITEVV